ncbi:MAG: nucleotidyltransferase family protein [Candidatus Eisenbacteria bacterium]
MVENMTGLSAAILAGGLGSRLSPVLAGRQKVMAEFGGQPFLAYLLDQLAGVGVPDVVLCTGHLGEQVRAALGETHGPLHLTYSQEASPRGTAGALRRALPLLKSDTVLVMNGDSFCEADLGAFWTWHCAREAEASLLLARVPDTGRYGRVRVDTDGFMLSFGEKDGTTGPGWINAGIYLISRSLLVDIPPDQMVSLERAVFPTWIGRRLYGYRCEGRFLDIGTPETYAAAERFLEPYAPTCSVGRECNP